MSFPHMVVPRIPVPTRATRRRGAGAARPVVLARIDAATVPEATMNSRRVTTLSSVIAPSPHKCNRPSPDGNGGRPMRATSAVVRRERGPRR